MSVSKILQEMKSLPPIEFPMNAGRELQISFLVPVRSAGKDLERTVGELASFLEHNFPDMYEVILIPNGPRKEGEECTYKIADRLANRWPHVVVATHVGPHGKGAALRTGFGRARGKWIFFIDADLPYKLDVVKQMMEVLRAGADFVTGNRRLPESHFLVPVPVLHLAYRRHCLGMMFNRLVRLLLPIKVTDTQAGIKGMSRRMAEAAFSLQSCPGFLFDIEFFLCADACGFRHMELPVTLHLVSEKSTVRLLREGLLALWWLLRIWWKHLHGHYKLPVTVSAEFASVSSYGAHDIYVKR